MEYTNYIIIYLIANAHIAFAYAANDYYTDDPGDATTRKMIVLGVIIVGIPVFGGYLLWELYKFMFK